METVIGTRKSRKEGASKPVGGVVDDVVLLRAATREARRVGLAWRARGVREPGSLVVLRP